MSSLSAKRILSLLTFFSAGCASVRPAWTVAPPLGYRNDFFTGSGTGGDHAEARKVAIADAVAEFARSGRLTIEVRDSTRSTITQRSGAGKIRLSEVDKATTDIIMRGESPTIRGLRLREEYTEKAANGVETWALISVPKTSGIREPPTRSSIVLRSALFPGWGQYAMGSERKGMVLALGVTAAVIGAVSFSSLRSENLARANTTQIQASRTYNIGQANRYRTLDYASVAGAVAIWGYGVIDAASSPTKLYVRGGPQRSIIGVSVAVAR